MLIVCTGNICRSPIAERLLQSGLDDLSPGTFRVQSAGTHAVIGAPIDARAASAIVRHGGSVSQFSARQVTAAQVQENDLLLALSREHRGAIVGFHPAAVNRTFTILEFARCLQALSISNTEDSRNRWREAIPTAARLRGPLSDPLHDDIADPYRKDDAAYEDTISNLLPALDTLLDWEAAARSVRRFSLKSSTPNTGMDVEPSPTTAKVSGQTVAPRCENQNVGQPVSPDHAPPHTS